MGTYTKTSAMRFPFFLTSPYLSAVVVLCLQTTHKAPIDALPTEEIQDKLHAVHHQNRQGNELHLLLDAMMTLGTSRRHSSFGSFSDAPEGRVDATSSRGEAMTARDDLMGIWARGETKEHQEVERELNVLRRRMAKLCRRIRTRQVESERGALHRVHGYDNNESQGAATSASEGTSQDGEHVGMRHEERREEVWHPRSQLPGQEQAQRHHEKPHVLQNEIRDLKDNLQVTQARCASLESAVFAEHGQLEESRGDVREAMERVTELEKQIQRAQESEKAIKEETREEIEALEFTNHDLSREVMTLEASLEEAQQAAESARSELFQLQVGREEAELRTEAEKEKVEELSVIKLALAGQVRRLEEEQRQCTARLSLMEEEVQVWRQRAEDVSEWVGVMCNETEKKEAGTEEVPIPGVLAAEGRVQTEEYQTAENVLNVTRASTAEASTATAATMTTPQADSLPLPSIKKTGNAGSNRVEALLQENLALRKTIEGLRGEDTKAKLS